MKTRILFLLCLLVIGLRIEDALFNPVFNPDKMEQLSAARSLLEGHGVARPFVSSANPEAISYEPLVQWPPGYSWLAAVFLRITGNWYNTVICFDLISVLLLLTALALLLSLIPGFNQEYRMLWFCILTLNTSVVNFNTSVDTFSMACYLGFFALALYSGEKNRIQIIAGVIAGLLLWGTFIMRYAYQPLAFILPITLWLIYRIFKRRDQNSFILSSFLTLISGTLLYFLMKPSGNLNPGYIQESGSGFLWDNLKSFHYQFLFEGFFSTKELLIMSTRFSALAWISVLLAISVSVWVIWKLFLFIIDFFRELKSGENEKFSFRLIAATALVSMGFTLALLTWLSLTNPKQTWAVGGWTFVQEARYYVPCWIGLLFITLYPLDDKLLFHKKVFFAFIGMLLLINIFSFGIYKRLSIAKHPHYFSMNLDGIGKYSQYRQYFEALKLRNRIPVFCGLDAWSSLEAELAGLIPLKKELNQPFSLQEPLSLLTFAVSTDSLKAGETIPELIGIEGRTIVLTQAATEIYLSEPQK